MTHSAEKRSHYTESYGAWAGNTAGRKPDYNRCCESVTPARQWYSVQCSKPCGHGPDKAYCSIHDPAAVARRQEASHQMYLADQRRHALGSMSPMVAAMLLIEAGHNDPRALAKEVLDKYRSKEWWKEPSGAKS